MPLLSATNLSIFKKACILYATLILISTLLQSCCEEIYTVTSETYAGFTDLVGERDLNPDADTIRGPFVYGISSKVIADNFGWDELGMIQTANALSCNEEYINTYVPSTASVVLDKAFFLDGLVVEAGTNLMTLADTWDSHIVYPPLHFKTRLYEFSLQVWVDEEFLKRADFLFDNYTFHARVQLEDGTQIESFEEVRIEIQ